MANIDAILGYNKSASVSNKLLAVYGNDVVNIDTGLGFGLNLTSPSTTTLETFLDHVFLQDYAVAPRTYNGTSWGYTNVSRTWMAKDQKRVKTRMYLANINFVDPQSPSNAGPFPSRVAFCDLPKNGKVSWGVEWGTNLSGVVNSKVVTTTNSIQDFVANGIKIGDPFYITSGFNTVFTSFVQRVDSRYQITLVDPLPETLTNGHFWVGSNWVDVGTDDNDYLVALGENDDKVLFFKRFSLWRYNHVSLQRVKDSPGTTSRKSVINIGPYTFYFHGSSTNTRKTGIYMYNGVSSMLISRAIQPFIDGISASNYPNVVCWAEGSRLRAFVGDITNTPRGISVTNAVLTLDIEGNQWSIDPIADVIKSAGRFSESNAEKFFIGTDDNEVMETPSGNTHNTAPIPWSITTGPIYPSGSDIINTYNRLQIVSRGGRGIQVAYKLLGKPEDDDDQWNSIGDLQHNYQEINIPVKNNKGKGYDIKLMDSEGNANNFSIQKIAMFYVPSYTRDTV